MTEIAQLFESALRQNQAKAAMGTVARMPAETTLRELLESDAGAAVRALSLRDLAQALQDAGFHGGRSRAGKGAGKGTDSGAGERKRVVAPERLQSRAEAQSREEQIYRRILEAIVDEPLTIGQLAKRLEIEVDELRGYLTWMKKMAKVVSSGRARATRYHVAPT